ncbi:MAG: hypothetical protein CMJ64_13245 [Planctomycetaceae bacterium]|nr:hypothetical protein [Planctomycetaceae bacterium]
MIGPHELMKEHKWGLQIRALSLIRAVTFFAVTFFVICCCMPSAEQAAEPTKPPAYNHDIRPILAEKCFRCHGADSAAREADLRLDQRKSAVVSRAVVPGKPDGSELLRRVTSTDPDKRMPPADTQLTLNDREKELLKSWIADGAEYQEHWSFVRPLKTPLPQIERAEWPHNAIDHFVGARLQEEGLAPSGEASRRALVRRLSLDITGLPPRLEEVAAFVADGSDEAYKKVVDRLLKSSRYGEHMARYWLDAARYADSNGYQYDTERTMWPWRDWVIRAFNNNMPFDQFTIEQLAGDLLPNATNQQRLATGFNRNHPITIEGGVIDEEYRTEYVIDRITTTSTVWMGLAMGCARCHDHKFDPLTRVDFYSFFAFFNNVPERGNSGFAPKQKAPTFEQEQELADIATQLAAIDKTLEAIADQVAEQQAQWEATASKRVRQQWQILSPTEMASSGGSTLTLLDDQSVLASGAKPSNDDYELTFALSNPKITAIRLEAITHESLPHKGAGRAFNSNFVLSEFEAAVVENGASDKPVPIKLASVSADYSQKNYEVARSIDSNLGTGWAVDGPTRKENATAVYLLAVPLALPAESILKVTMRHRFGSTHSIGRFRISVTDDPSFNLPADVAQALAVAEAKRTNEQLSALREYFIGHIAEGEVGRAGRRRAELQGRRSQIESSFPETLVMAEMAKPRETFMLIRGQYDKKGEKVTAATPTFLPSPPGGEKIDRLALARWLVSRDHPLTARVYVNRLWQQLFGIGIVRTVEDLGTQGEWPTHQEMLDWLAVDFMESGWDVKHIVKTIVMSSTYRQSSIVTPQLLKRDPENRLLARGARSRLPAEMVRDNALAVSDLLVEKVGGPSVYPYQPPGLWLEINNRPNYSKAYPTGKGDDLYRRSLYTFWKRTVPHPAMAAFDSADREICTVRRSRTNTPLQALVMLNDPQFVEAAKHLAERMIVEGGDGLANQIGRGMEIVLSRPPTGAELEELSAYYRIEHGLFREDSTAAERLLSVGESARNQDLDLTDHAAMTSVARLLLNLNEAITRQ